MIDENKLLAWMHESYEEYKFLRESSKDEMENFFLLGKQDLIQDLLITIKLGNLNGN